MTGDGRITALPGVAGVVEVGGGREPQAALSTTETTAASTTRIGRMARDFALRLVRGKLPRSASIG